MTPRQIPLVSTTAEGGVSGSELLVNVYPRPTDGGKYPYALTQTPGLAFFIELPTSPILAMHRSNERAFAVTPTKFYEIFGDGTFEERGDVDLSGNVVMADNGLDVCAVDGKKGYFYTISSEEVNEIISAGWSPASSVTFQDGYFIFGKTDSTEFFISDLLSTVLDPLKFAAAEGSPDNLVRVVSDHRELFLFGTQTTEVWYNNADTDFTFTRNNGVFIEKGCAAPFTVAKQNNTLYFVGSDLIVYMLNGYTPTPISNNAVEDSLKNIDLSDAFAYTYQYDGSLFYVLTIPGKNITWRFDVSTGSWHRLKNSQFDRHPSSCHVYFDNKNLVGDFQNGRIYELSTDVFTDDGDTITREFILPTVSIGRDRFSLYSLELDMSSGIGVAAGQGSNPVASLQISKDSGKTWSNLKFSTIGKIGDYLSRVKWNRLGNSRQFTAKIRISDPVPIDIGGAYVEIR